MNLRRAVGTVRFRFLLLFLLLVLPLYALLAAIAHSAAVRLETNAVSAELELLGLAISRIGGDLEAAAGWLETAGNEMSSWESPPPGVAPDFTLFRYPGEGEPDLHVSQQMGGALFRQSLSRRLEEGALDHLADSGLWHPHSIGGEYFLFYLKRSENALLGACVPTEVLAAPLHTRPAGNTHTFLTTLEYLPTTGRMQAQELGLRLSFGGGGASHRTAGGYFIIGRPSGLGEFHLVTVLPKSQVLGPLLGVRWVVTAAGVILVLLILYGLGMVRRTVTEPVAAITTVMNRYSLENPDIRLSQRFRAAEMADMRSAFNNMLRQIELLKVLMYEEKLEKQQAEFRHLQLQVNPHFFLNSLNIVFQLAQARRYELIQDMTHCLVEYFRYMFRSNSDFVTLRSEIQHTRNYIRIQEMRFPNSLCCRFQVEEDLLGTPVPPLIIQTFVENAIKYAVRLEKLTVIQIHITPISIRGVDCLSIRISDNGEGFPFEVLDRYYESTGAADFSGENIGIRNVSRRLRHLYAERSHMAIGNDGKSGAYVDITFPRD